MQAICGAAPEIPLLVSPQSIRVSGFNLVRRARELLAPADTSKARMYCPASKQLDQFDVVLQMLRRPIVDLAAGLQYRHPVCNR
jgi:hypothetical protein